MTIGAFTGMVYKDCRLEQVVTSCKVLDVSTNVGGTLCHVVKKRVSSKLWFLEGAGGANESAKCVFLTIFVFLGDENCLT